MTSEDFCSEKVDSLNGFTVGDLVYCTDMNALTPVGRPKDDRPTHLLTIWSWGRDRPTAEIMYPGCSPQNVFLEKLSHTRHLEGAKNNTDQ